MKYITKIIKSLKASGLMKKKVFAKQLKKNSKNDGFIGALLATLGAS